MLNTSRRGIFGAPFQIDMRGSPYHVPPEMDGSTAAPLAAPKLGLMDKIGLAGDVLSGSSATAQRLQPQFEEYAQQAAEQRRQAAQWSLWERQQEYKRANPDPINNDTVNDYNFRAQTLGKQAADDWLKSANDPVVTVTLPGNRVYSGPRSGLTTALGGGGAPAAAPAPGAIEGGYRFKGGNPADPSAWEPVAGGAGSQGPATFR